MSWLSLRKSEVQIIEVSHSGRAGVTLNQEDDDKIRAMIQHEDNLRSQRLGWFLTLNGFLFAALSVAWTRSDTTSLVLVIGAVGLVVGLSTIATMRVSDLAIKDLKDRATNASPPVVAMTTERLMCLGGVNRFLRFLYLWMIAPLIMAVAWVFIVVYRLVNY